jgi:hypothetical protein
MEHTRINLDIDTHDVANRVFEQRELWESRSSDYPFFTLGGIKIIRTKRWS